MSLSGGLPKSFLAMIALTSLGCLQVAGVGTGGTSGGAGATGGRSTTGGGSTTGPSCAGVSCAGFYACDPRDGLCKCGGQLCNSGNCDPSGACLAACDAKAGTFTIPGSNGPGSALTLPPANLNEFYSSDVPLSCSKSPNVVWAACFLADGGPACTEIAREKLPPGLVLFSSGTIQGVPLTTGSFAFGVEASVALTDGGVFEVFQNVLITVERDAGSGQ